MSRLIPAICLSFLAFVYCKSPTSSTPSPQPLGKGYFMYDNVKYNLDNMLMTGYTSGVDSLKFEVFLLENPVKNMDSLMTHTVNTAAFWFHSPTIAYLDSGTYTLSNAVPGMPYTISGAFCGIDYSSDISKRTNEPYDFKTLTATIKRTNNSYTIDFTGVLANDQNVEGHYEGTFIPY